MLCGLLKVTRSTHRDTHGPATGNERSPAVTSRDRGVSRMSISADARSQHLVSTSATPCCVTDSMAERDHDESDQDGDLEVDPIDCIQPMQFHRGWRHMIVPPQTVYRRRRCVENRLQMTVLVVR